MTNTQRDFDDAANEVVLELVNTAAQMRALADTPEVTDGALRGALRDGSRVLMSAHNTVAVLIDDHRRNRLRFGILGGLFIVILVWQFVSFWWWHT